MVTTAAPEPPTVGLLDRGEDLESQSVDVPEEQRPVVTQALDLADVGTGVDQPLFGRLELSE